MGQTGRMDGTFVDWVSSLTQFAPDHLDPTGELPVGAIEFLTNVFETKGAVPSAELDALWVGRQLELAHAAFSMVMADYQVTTEFTAPSFEYRIEDGNAIRPAYRGQYATMPITHITAAYVTFEVAEFVQDEVMEELHRAWPTCPQHGFGLHARTGLEHPDWYCRTYHHSVGTIGQLPRPAATAPNRLDQNPARVSPYPPE
jgi:hypothetical protein